jgi:hypothetical protein
MAGQVDVVVTHEDGEWVSRREMAQLARCSESTIGRDVDKHDLETRIGLKGEVLVRVADFERIDRIKPGDVPTGLTGSQAAELRRVLADNARLTSHVGELTGRLEQARISQDVITAQLAVKDEQIKSLLALAARSAR